MVTIDWHQTLCIADLHVLLHVIIIIFLDNLTLNQYVKTFEDA